MNRACPSALRVLILACWVLALSCQQKKTTVAWVIDLPVTGSQSSPRAQDLNGDGVLDIIMGAGRNEYQKSAQGILAFDGKSGNILWEQSAVDQVYGSATFYDVTADGVADVFIGGRGPHFTALDGNNGHVIWEYKYAYDSDPILKFARFNFNNSLLVPDQDGDGLMDLLTVNGGNAKADPSSEINRFPGVMMIMNSKTGAVIAADTMPDGRETYMSPILFKQPGQTDLTIIFGTGGETLNGNLYQIALADLKAQRLQNAKVLASEQGHGFIAPASAADINRDGYFDIVAISHGSTAFAIDGKTSALLWKRSVGGTESSNSLAVGNFNGDGIPDFFTFVSKGQWPNSTGSVQLMLDGSDGHIAFQDSIGCTGYSSPVVYDLNDDGVDEVLISVNEFDCSLGFAGKNPTTMENKLVSIDFKSGAVEVVDQLQGFKNIFSTPWIGDLDSDGYLDIVECQYYQRGMLLSFLGMRVKRIDTDIPMKKPVEWGAYMGTDGNGWYRK
ncbi:MAG TPA: FG-GAP-like repeat-containing protein [Chryseolinea sp.]|nr:FG-GAP-like repeat-containing protein [Chryseolinea sp.]